MPEMSKESGVTPRVTAGYAKFLYEEDEYKGQKKYKFKVVMDPSVPEQKAWIDERIRRHKEVAGDLKLCPVKKGLEKYKQDPAMYYAQFTSSRRPKIVDTKKQDITNSEVRVFGGDVVRVAWVDNPVESGAVTGCFLYVNKVMLVDKRGGGADFEEEEGYVASEEERMSTYEAKGADTDATDDEDDDF